MSNARAQLQQESDVSRETMERLDIYSGLLEKWTKRINLVSPTTLPDLWSRHFLDSAQLFGHLPAHARTWLDLGSGGGFPGAVIAILAAEKAPELTTKLIESDQRKAAFLRTVARETAVDFSVIAQRIEDVPPQSADVVSARALASVKDLLGYVSRHITEDGTTLLQKGASWQTEVSSALDTWRFHWKKHTSVTDEEAVILEIGGIERV